MKFDAIVFPNTHEQHNRDLFEVQNRVVCQLLHPNIAKYRETIKDEYNSIIIFHSHLDEYSLANRIKSYSGGQNHMPQQLIASILRQIAMSLRVLGKLNIAHCGIKPSNIFVVDSNYVRLGGFISAQNVLNKNAQNIYVDDIYSAPELKTSKGRKEFDTSVDIWSLGCVLYEMVTLSTYSPSQDLKLPKEKNYDGEFVEQLSELLSSMLILENPEKRITVDKLLESSLLKDAGLFKFDKVQHCLFTPIQYNLFSDNLVTDGLLVPRRIKQPSYAIILIKDDAKDEYGETSLHWAARNGMIKVVERLLQMTPSLVEITDDDSKSTALHLAVQRGHLQLFEMLIKHKASLNAKNNRGMNLAHLASHNGHVQIVNRIFEIENALIKEKNDESGQTCFHYAAERGHLQVIKKLLMTCPDLIDENDDNTRNTLHFAVRGGHVSVVEKLLETPELIDVKDVKGMTALHYAAEQGYLIIVEKLLNESPDLMKKTDRKGRIALHCAAEKGQLGILQKLLKICSNQIGITDFAGMTALHYASKNGHLNIVKELLEESFILHKVRDHKEYTFLHYAIQNQHLNVVKYVLEKCPKLIYEKDMVGKTELMHALEEEKLNVAMQLCEISGFIDEKDNDGKTALHYAAERGYLDMVKKLLKMSPELASKRDNNKKSAFDYAINKRHFEISKILENVSK